MDELTARCRRLDHTFARPMFYISLASLLSFAVLLHFHERPEYFWIWCAGLVLSALVWPCYVAEFVLAWRAGSPRARERFWCCVLPPLRIAARDHETGQRVWFPQLKWQAVSRELRDRLERAGNIPMITIACLVLPLIAIEFQYAEQLENHPRWAGGLAAATALIWFAFAYEFVVMFSLAEKKFEYCKTHWLDLAIILLPLVAFLRALRLGRLLRLQQLSRTARIYRMRGLAMRAWRALLVLEIVRRVLQGRPEQRLKRLDELILAKQQELTDLEAERQTLRQRVVELELMPDVERVA